MTDRTFEDLQRRSTNLNRKKFAKWFLFLLVATGIIFLVVANFMNNKKLIKQTMIIKKPAETTTITPKPKKIQIKPSYDTILLKPTIVIPKIEKKIENVKEKKAIIKAKGVINPPKKVEKVQEKIKIKVSSFDNKESLLKSYNSNENFSSALKLSNYYFKNKKYEKAIYYSKIANHYMSSSFEPWLIYAKAKMKQNKKEEAIKAIETFLSYFSSDAAERLLLSMKGNK